MVYLMSFTEAQHCLSLYKYLQYTGIHNCIYIIPYIVDDRLYMAWDCFGDVRQIWYFLYEGTYSLTSSIPTLELCLYSQHCCRCVVHYDILWSSCYVTAAYQIIAERQNSKLSYLAFIYRIEVNRIAFRFQRYEMKMIILKILGLFRVTHSQPDSLTRNKKSL